VKLVDKKASMEVAQVMPRTCWLYRARSTRSEILVITILLLGLLLRIHGLGTESLWIDEGTSVRLARSSLTHVIEDRAHSVNPPLYFIILHYWIRLFGESEFSLRLPSAIFGSLALIMIYRVGDLIFGKRTGALSCFLLAISMFHIEYSQEARGYSLMVLMALISMYFFVKLLERTSFAFLIGYVISSALLIYTHFFGLLIVLVQNVFFISIRIFSNNAHELDFKRWVLAQGMLAILYTPWVGFLTAQIVGIEEGFWIPTPTISSIIETLLAYSAKSKPLLLCFLALSFLAILAPKRTAGKPNWKTGSESIDGCSRSLNLSNAAKICLLVLWLAVPVVLPFVASQISTPIYYTRYTIAASLAFYILIARGIQEIPNRYFKSFVVISIVTYSLLGINGYYAKTNKQEI
jgi:mannosyltransferase